MTDNHLIINAKDIHKRFGDKRVLSGLDFQLPAGQIYAICGKNGSGKSVFLRILTGLMFPTSGGVTIFGQRIGADVEFPSDTGALIDHPGFLLNESGRRNLLLLAKISGKATPEKIDETLRFVGLDPEDRKPFKTYSVGMRQRLGLAQAIMEDPSLLILDEPTAGLDFDGQREIYDYLIELRKQGKTILITSHSQGEIKLLCDKAFLLRDGKLEVIPDIQVEDFSVAPNGS
ncbi:MAG: ATP-binding cassette domain-containing protein [Chloroflexota bacterium]|nr:ATP-binding cassette domain-containing protein [Chloroflexota bacterium]